MHVEECAMFSGTLKALALTVLILSCTHVNGKAVSKWGILPKSAVCYR